MEIQKIIEELKLKIDKLPKEANWFGNVDHIRQHIKELEQAFSQTNVSRIAVDDVVLEAEKRVAKCIKDDIEFGYDLKMIKDKIKTGSYVGSSVETYRSYKRHFG